MMHLELVVARRSAYPVAADGLTFRTRGAPSYEACATCVLHHGMDLSLRPTLIAKCDTSSRPCNTLYGSCSTRPEALTHSCQLMMLVLATLTDDACMKAV